MTSVERVQGLNESRDLVILEDTCFVDPCRMIFLPRYWRSCTAMQLIWEAARGDVDNDDKLSLTGPWQKARFAASWLSERKVVPLLADKNWLLLQESAECLVCMCRLSPLPVHAQNALVKCDKGQGRCAEILDLQESMSHSPSLSFFVFRSLENPQHCAYSTCMAVLIYYVVVEWVTPFSSGWDRVQSFPSLFKRYWRCGPP